MEEEASEILHDATEEEPKKSKNLGTEIAALFRGIGLRRRRTREDSGNQHSLWIFRMIILDTDVLSALMRQRPELRVVEWLDRQSAVSIWTTTISVMEIHFGLQTMPKGSRQKSMARAFELLIGEGIERRIASFDVEAAGQAASLMATRKVKGRHGDSKDAMIAAIAVANRATLATRNTPGDLPVPVINPWLA